MGNINAAFLIDLRDDNLDDVAQFQHVFRLFNPLVINLRYVKQTVGSREQFNKRAELLQPDNLAVIDFADLGFAKNLIDRFPRPS